MIRIPLSLFLTLLVAQSAPKAFSKYLPTDDFVKGSAGMVVPPVEIEEYIIKVQEGAQKDPEWFIRFSKESQPGVPLPYHEKLGLTKEEYKDYIATWDKRVFQEVEPVALRLEKSSDGNWMIRASGSGFPISSLRYNEKTKELSSPNGILKQIDDIAGDKDSILGAWKGQEWMHESETTISKTIENFAIGKTDDKPVGYMIYRIRELSSEGRSIYDKRIVIQFPIAK